MAVFSGLLVFYTWKLYTGGERHSQRELRAYVFPTEIKVGNFKTGNPLTAFVRIENTGQTPAYELSCVTKFMGGTFPQTEFDISDEDFASASSEYLGGHSVNWRTTSSTTVPTPEEQEGVTQGVNALYVFGEIRYVDAFGQNRRTTFRAIARGHNGFMLHDKDDRQTLVLSFDPQGNVAN
jgi:hypothetical protein